jgi:hypothetical protein
MMKLFMIFIGTSRFGKTYQTLFNARGRPRSGKAPKRQDQKTVRDIKCFK